MSDDRRTLRELGEWRPQSILRRLGPAPGDPQHLAYVLLALTVLHGPARVHGLLSKLETEGRRLLPRLQAHAEIEGMDKALIDDTTGELSALLRELGPTRARVANEPRGGQPVGMNTGDLKVITRLLRAVITGQEVLARPNAAGAVRTRRLLSSRPIIADAVSWARRLLPSGTQGAAMLARGPSHVVVVFGDGRLAYDPAAQEPDDDGP